MNKRVAFWWRKPMRKQLKHWKAISKQQIIQNGVGEICIKNFWSIALSANLTFSGLCLRGGKEGREISTLWMWTTWDTATSTSLRVCIRLISEQWLVLWKTATGSLMVEPAKDSTQVFVITILEHYTDQLEIHDEDKYILMDEGDLSRSKKL